MIIIGMLSSSLITIIILMCFRSINKKDVKLDEVNELQQIIPRQKHMRAHSNMVLSSINDTVLEHEMLTARRSDDENQPRG